MSPTSGDPSLQMVMEALSRIERRLDSFVTTPTHVADMRRLDDAITALTADLGQEKAERAQQLADARAEFLRTLTEQRASIERLTAAISAEADARRKGDEGDLSTIRDELKAERADRKKDRQWLVGAVIAVLGVVVAVAALVLR